MWSFLFRLVFLGEGLRDAEVGMEGMEGKESVEGTWKIDDSIDDPLVGVGVRERELRIDRGDGDFSILASSSSEDENIVIKPVPAVGIEILLLCFFVAIGESSMFSITAEADNGLGSSLKFADVKNILKLLVASCG